MKYLRFLLYFFLFLLYINQVQAECVGNLTRRDEPRTNTLGCFIKDNLSNDTLDGLTKINFSDPYTDRDRILMDPGLCIMFCANYLFNYSALIRGSECRCGNQDGLKAYIQTSNSSCNIPCVGNDSYYCGGQEAYTIYTAALAHNKIPSGGLPPINKKLDILNSLKNDTSYKGCFKDSPYCNVRSLNGIQYEEEHMTVDTCIKYCSQQNYKYAGLELATQCFCGNSYDSFTALSSEDCGSSCGGNSSQVCGGHLALSIYEVPPNPVPSNSSSSSLSVGIIAAIVIGGILIFILILFLIRNKLLPLIRNSPSNEPDETTVSDIGGAQNPTEAKETTVLGIGGSQNQTITKETTVSGIGGAQNPTEAKETTVSGIGGLQNPTETKETTVSGNRGSQNPTETKEPTETVEIVTVSGNEGAENLTEIINTKNPEN
ncbi:7795_t:CDS:2 [Acaulospora morrowiae]|uniref:7795_t:CDS:1 n=1 Tax=Acaulospora morrowiae TaxID=94023 RepID=A0A9N8VZL9_9GLOM|nr:7795_t:CDS:2 [Acaulospora morrowiae]